MLSPFLFALVIDYIMKRTMDENTFGIGWEQGRLKDLDFADDIALMSETHEAMQRMTTRLQELGERVGLYSIHQ